jgi:NAD(P)-dependent dehydrogenase (short-subunit alcohol dehydrogenase family)
MKDRRFRGDFVPFRPLNSGTAVNMGGGKSMLYLRDKAVVIIGGTTGMGLSAAKACAEAGARVVVVGRSAESADQAAKLLGDSGAAMIGDANDPAVAPRAIELAVSRFGGFHGLYHVAGGSGRSHGDGPLHELTNEGIDFTIQTNLNGLIYSNRAAVRRLLAVGHGGSIVNIASVLAYSPAPNIFSTHAYAAAKSAVVGFTRACAAYYAPHDIRFNVIAPALIATPMSLRAQEDPEALAYIHTKQPLDGGRIGEPEDVDGAAVYFLSDHAKFVTGQVLGVDGGWAVSEGQVAKNF